MNIAAGTKLGPYQITDQIGAGGMGEVYRATDTRLDRAVAIKVLRKEMADNRERRERFEREARAISSLNHPHICTLHDVGEQDGTHFLVMELVEGQTLEQRLQKGRLPLDEALKYAIQIADALDKAHRQGVVHRDLKPGNIMITRSGVKLLDFGLAKLKGEAVPTSGLSQAPTQDRPLTTEGTILGTLQYMAPEQLEGKDADNRSDIFAFGAVVYEIVTGQRAFNGTSQASLIGAIMNSEPKPMTEIQEMTPAGLDHIVRTCLAKDAEDRWQTARDLMRELRRVGTGVSPGSPVSASSLPAAPARSRQLAMVAIAAIAGALLASGLFFMRGPRQEAGPKQAGVTRLTLPLTPAKVLSTFSLARNFGISPDGRRVVFQDNAGLWIRDLQEDEAVFLRGTECRGCSPVFSPDGEWVAFYFGAQLAKISVQGGAPVILCDSGEGSGGISWGPDGYIVFALAGARNTVLMRVHENGGKPAPLLPAPVDADTRWPFIIDGGRAVIFSSALAGQNFDQGNIQLFDLETKETKVLITGGGAGAQITADGHLIFARAGSLMAVPFDAKRREVRGQPVSILNGIAYDASGAGQWSVADNGTLVFVEGSAANRQLIWVSAGGQGVAAHPTTGDYYDPRLSPSGDALAAELLAEGDDIWVLDLKRQVKEIVSSPKGEDETSAWSPDGQRVAWATGADNERVIIERRADGSGDPKELWHGQHHIHVLQYTPDGRYILFETESPNAGIWILPLDGSEPSGRVLIDTPANEALARVSPNGQWIAYVSDVTGAEQIYVEPFPGRGPRIPVGPGTEPVWARDGRRLYYRASGAFWAVGVSAGNTFTPGAPVRLFDDLFGTKGNRHTGYDVAADGRLMVVGNTESERQIGALKIIQNWLTEVEKRSPTH